MFASGFFAAQRCRQDLKAMAVCCHSPANGGWNRKKKP
jgi:hypothetical protein